MKVKALTTDVWAERNKKGVKTEESVSITHYRDGIYEVVSKTTVAHLYEGYTIKIGDKYGAIKKEDCEIVEGSEEDLINSNTNSNNIFIQCL